MSYSFDHSDLNLISFCFNSPYTILYMKNVLAMENCRHARLLCIRLVDNFEANKTGKNFFLKIDCSWYRMGSFSLWCVSSRLRTNLILLLSVTEEIQNQLEASINLLFWNLLKSGFELIVRLQEVPTIRYHLHDVESSNI